ncbi:uncharacterized protein PAC_17810 [Phialocephala subalpina]|uniref:Zn(2)-C6 fungal-type domain-containing protein n=1 Tax=Phialocephala subalpina TaxID=576137 RepID=A0A1L7XS81_9HELO|nr:uncharacterized protein PAC_17810 [Phialocephala subalpina]
MSSRADGESSIATRAPAGCRSCKQRRIQCDRGLPACFKCSKRKLVCPGYKPQLRWANAIAVRGRFKGMQFPQEGEAVSEARNTSSTKASPLSPLEGAEQDEISINGETAISGVRLVPDFPNDDVVRQLLGHYDEKIASTLVWLDSEHNAYRCLVLPLAQRQPALMLSILAISAKHLSTTSSLESSFPESACDAAIQMITAQVQQVTSQLAEGRDLSNEISIETAEWMLASMLTLLSYETIGSGSMDWQSHRQAARILVHALGTATRRDNELYEFLRNQLSIFDVLASTTNFDSSITENAILPNPDLRNVLFSDYLRFIYRVTLQSREKFQDPASTQQGDASTPLTPKTLRDGFEQARGLTLMAARPLQLSNYSKQRDFVRIVDIYHHAGLLYSYRCLRFSSSIPGDVEYSRARLLDSLEVLEEIPTWVQDLPWPVFILGTESYGNKSYQASVRTIYEMIIETMGFNHYDLVLRFLDEFWSGDDPDWSVRARGWEARGIQLLAV